MTCQAAGSIRRPWTARPRWRGQIACKGGRGFMTCASVIHIKSNGQALRYVLSMDRNSLYIWLWLAWMAFLVVGIAYVLFSAGATWL
jgi:hypothetical protein